MYLLYGFRKLRQKKDNLLTIIQTAQEGFNVKKKRPLFFFDVAAAFDKVWQDGLFFKLVKLKVPYYLIRVIASFLNGRTFAVKVDGEMSIIHVIECGVPQGGVLSPTLFQIFINDIPTVNKEGETVLLFADDIVFLKRFKYLVSGKVCVNLKTETEKDIQEFLNNLENWMNDWRLSLAPHKCAQITFSKARSNVNISDIMNIKLYGQNIPSEKNPKFLGVLFDSKLNFEPHFKSIKKKVGDRLNLLKILSFDKTWRLNEKLLVTMFKSLILSVLDYASVVTGNMKSCSILETIQNNALRIIFKKRLIDKVPAQELREKAGITTVLERHKLLMNDYYERALISQNPLLQKVFGNYKKFRTREYINENLIDRVIESGRQKVTEMIKKHNELCLKKSELYPTVLCGASRIIRQMILDDYSVT